MTIKTSYRLMRGIIPWNVLYAVDTDGLVQVVIMGSNLDKCREEMNKVLKNIAGKHEQ